MLLIFLDSFVCLNTIDMCVKEMACKGKYSYDCDLKYCSKDRETCEDFGELKIYLKAINNLQINKKISHSLKTIKLCPVNHYKWKESDICFNTAKCNQIKGLIHLVGKASIDFYKHAVCPCHVTMYKFQCGKHYCALSENACYAFKQIKKTNIMFLACGD